MKESISSVVKLRFRIPEKSQNRRREGKKEWEKVWTKVNLRDVRTEGSVMREDQEGGEDRRGV